MTGGANANDGSAMLELGQLRKRVGELEAQNAELQARAEDLEALNAELSARLAAIQRYIFGRRSERYIDHPELPFPGDEEDPQAPKFVENTPDDEEDDHRPHRGRRSRRRGVGRIRKDLPRIREIIDIPENERVAPCGCVMEEIGEEVTEELEYRPASFFIREIVRKKYACKRHEEHGVSTPVLPSRPIAKGMAGAGLLAHVVTSKYKDHLPLHRQRGIYLRQGVDIAESTMVDWIGDISGLTHPIVECVRDDILRGWRTSTDDTPICVQDRNSPNGSRRAYLWAYLGEPGDVVFRYTRGRSRDGPLAFFGDYRGYVQADAYSGYQALFRRPGVIEVGCWAHARRRFFKALDTDPEPAKHMIAAIRMLYDVEVEADRHELDAEARLQLRHEKSKPLLEDVRAWLETLKRTVLPKSPIGRAVNYVINQWQPLNRFLDDGRLVLDNNRTERAIRQVAIGRKNWMFAGSDAGGERAATLYSLIGGCIELKLDPFEYLQDVIRRLPAGDDPRELTPRAWLAARS